MRQMTFVPTVWGARHIDWHSHTQVMGIVNVTPDSFSGDGLVTDADPTEWASEAATRATNMVAEGANIIDIGGASSRPGALPVDPAIESARVVSAVRAVVAALPSTIPVSIDTSSAEVAAAALQAGASMLNDISGLRADPEMARVAAAAGVPIILMANMRNGKRHALMSDITRYLSSSMEYALAAGVRWDHLIIDPGFGFGLTSQENMMVIRELDRLTVLGRPIALGVSRKSTLGRLLGGAPPEQRLEASLAAAVAGVMHGARLIRTHDIAATARALRVADAIAYGDGRMFNEAL